MNDLHDQLSDSAHSFEVSEASSADLRQRARRRGRRSNIVKASAVLAVAGVGVYGVARLSSSGGDVIVTGAGPDSAPPPNEGTATGSLAATTPIDPSGVGQLDRYAGLPQTRAAEFIPGGYDWAAYRADSPEGLALRFDPDEVYALSTSPGAIEETAVYKQTDGVWEPITELGLIVTDAQTNDAIYAIKRGGDNEPAGEITRIDLATGVTSGVAFPQDARVATQQVGRITVHSTTTLAARGDMLALLVGHWPEIDASDVELPPGWRVGEVTRGMVFAVREDCSYGETTVADSTIDIGPDVSVFDPGVEVVQGIDGADDEGIQGQSTEPPLDRIPASSDTQCDAIFPADELPLTDQERAAIIDGVGLWTSRGDQWTEVALPEASGRYSLEDLVILGQSEVTVDESGVRTWVGDRFLAVTDSNQLQPLFGGNPIRNPLGFEVTTAGITTDTVTKVDVPYVLTQQIGSDDWHATDLRTLGVDSETGPIVINSAEAVALNNGGVFAEADVLTGYPTEPIELTSDSGEYTLSLPENIGDLATPFDPTSRAAERTVTNNATGERLDDFVLSTESGRIEILRDDAVVATFDVDWTTVPALAFRGRFALLLSTDGLTYRATDHRTMLEAAGLSDFGMNPALRRVQQRGDQILFPSDLYDPATGEDVGTYVFVGTPR